MRQLYDFRAAKIETTRRLDQLHVTWVAPHAKVICKKPLRRKFKDMAIEAWCDELPDKLAMEMRTYLSSFQVHRILPRSLGGRNYNNLVLIEPKLHTQLHKIIDKQTLGMETGETRLIQLPVYDGWVWGVPKNFHHNPNLDQGIAPTNPRRSKRAAFSEPKYGS